MSDNRSDQKVADTIRQLESSFCNPMKLKQAEELKQELRDKGYSDREIRDMTD